MTTLLLMAVLFFTVDGLNDDDNDDDMEVEVVERLNDDPDFGTEFVVVVVDITRLGAGDIIRGSE